ncbi:MAG TPA: ATPase domain-containing protein [Terriglobales bacterium]|nr:ATPase domain-containing protein [Terriglobales bacterium]
MTNKGTTLTKPEPVRCSSGCPGLDSVLGGGFPAGHVYLLEGEPGTGKTTLALQFAADGLRRGEKVLYVTLSESRNDLLMVARNHGFNLDAMQILELKPDEQDLRPEGQYTVFHPSEVELNDRVQMVMKEVDRLHPTRLVIDALSEVRMLAKDPLRYRRQVLSLKDYAPSDCTVLLLDDRSSRHVELELHSIVHGVIALQKISRDYGKTRRRMEVTKLRGSAFREGYHDYVIQSGGVVIFPRLIAAEHRDDGSGHRPLVSSGIAELDALVGGGLDRGTSTLLIGPAGCGKTTIALRWVVAAAERGEKAAAFIFEETISTLKLRAAGLGMDLGPHLESGLIRIGHLDPAEMSPGEFVNQVQEAVDEGAEVIVIDSLNGFLQAMPGEQFLALHLHELLTYLNNCGVVTLMVLAQTGMIGTTMLTPVDVSYLTDNILALRYFEAHGEVRQAISMIKKRSGTHERTIRELQLGAGGIRVGQPLTNFQGVLTGIPAVIGQANGHTGGLRLNEQ